MKKLVRFGRKISIPSSLQIRQELRLFCLVENTRSLCAEAEGLQPAATWDEIDAHRAGVLATAA
jgi:hypothetical protein